MVVFIPCRGGLYWIWNEVKPTSSIKSHALTLFSLVDQNMYPFSTSYLVVFVLIVVMLAGNHALPMMLRFMIWLGTKIWRKGQINETLHFLLDHPRR